MTRIRDLFSEHRPIDRPIEKVIDYTADDPARLGREIDEYVVTDSLEQSFRRFIEVYDAGVRHGDFRDVGIWVSGFYGSGKSSFTKYLGFALDPERTVGKTRFLERLVEHFRSAELKQLYRATAASFPATVVMLDLAREQLVESTATTVTNVLYAKVLQQLGYSKVPKLADLEVRLDEAGRLDELRAAYRERFAGKGEWESIHDDPLLGPARVSQIVPAFLPDEFPTPESFRHQHFQERLGVTELADRMIRLIRRRTGREQIVILVDEVGQYVAPRPELMLDLDGLVRSFKEHGRGKVWLVATAQQTLSEIVERAIMNSAELYRLRDRFPVSIELDAADIKQITHRRLLTKRESAERELRALFQAGGEGEVIKAQTRVEGPLAALFGSRATPLGADAFAETYPFLPVHIDIVLALIRRLARRTGGTGLRSAIRVVQDLLVDVSRALPPGTPPIADREVGRLACADDLFDTLRVDIEKELPHVVEGVRRVERHPAFAADALAVRVAKAIAALQPLDDFPRTAENLAALLYPSVGARPIVEPVRDVLHRLVETRELGIVEVRGDADGDASGAAGYLFLSDKVRPLQQARDAYRPTTPEKRRLLVDILKQVFDPEPQARLENVKTVRASLVLEATTVAGEGADVTFLLQPTPRADRARRRDELVIETRTRADWHATIVWLVTWPEELDEQLEEGCRSAHVARTTPEHDADRDVSQYVRAERRRLERTRDALRQTLAAALHDGELVFHALARPAREHAATNVMEACAVVLADAARDLFQMFRHAPLAAKTEQAARFLEWDRPDRIPPDRDPLGLVASAGGRVRPRTQEPPLSEVLQEFRKRVDAAGTGRLQGAFVQDLFAAPPFGWSKDTTRYLFAALLAAGEIEVHVPGGVLRTPGPAAVEAFRNTATFNRVGLALRGAKPPIEALDRAAQVLERLFGVEVLPLEDHISRAVRAHVPPLMEKVGSLPDRLRLLGLPGEARARRVLEVCSDLIREDAGGAASLLGAPERDPFADVQWARDADRALDGDGETTILEATRLRAEIRDLADLFREVREIASCAQMTTIDEVLAAESFAARMPDLRGASVELAAELQDFYANRRAALEDAIAAARREVSLAGERARLDPEDREMIARRLAITSIPRDPAADRRLADLRRLLTHAARLPGLAIECLEVVAAQTAPPPRPPAATIEGEAQATQEVALRDLLPDAPLDSKDAVEVWLESLRRRLVELVDLGPIRIVDRRDD